MIGIGHKIPIPPKLDRRTWKKLKESITKHRIDSAQAIEQHRKRRKHDLEKIVQKLEHQHPNGDRDLYIKQIKDEIKHLT